MYKHDMVLWHIYIYTQLYILYMIQYMYIHVEYTHVIYVHEKHLKYQLIKPFGSLKITVRGAIHWHLLDELLGELLD